MVTVVQTQVNSYSNTQSPSVTLAGVTAGNLLVLTSVVGTTARDVTLPPGFIQRVLDNTSAVSIKIAYAWVGNGVGEVPPGTTTFAVDSGSAADDGNLSVRELAGVDLADPIPNAMSAPSAANSTSATIGPLTTTVADGLLIAVIGLNNGSGGWNLDWSDGFTDVFSETGSGRASAMAQRAVTATGTYSTTVSWVNSRPYVESMILVASDGAAAEQHSGGSSASISVSSDGSGSVAESVSGGSYASIQGAALGGGFAREEVFSGATSPVAVTAGGGGSASEAAAGGSDAQISVVAFGAGAVQEAISGGSTTQVGVSAYGVGAAYEAVSTGSTALVEVSAAGGGHSATPGSGGSTARVDVAGLGGGYASEVVASSATASVAATATGGGSANESVSGGSSVTVLVAGYGAGTALELVSGGSSAGVAVVATGAGTGTTSSGGSSARIAVVVVGGGFGLERYTLRRHMAARVPRGMVPTDRAATSTLDSGMTAR